MICIELYCCSVSWKPASVPTEQVLFASQQTLQMDLEILRGRLAEAEATAVPFTPSKMGRVWIVLTNKNGKF